MLQKVLVANRGEIAIRAFRAAPELGVRAVAVYTPDDRGSLHRQKADEAHEIGEPAHLVQAYLDVETLVSTDLAPGRRRRDLPGLRFPLGERGHVAAPMTGVATLAVEEGEQVAEGQRLGR